MKKRSKILIITLIVFVLVLIAIFGKFILSRFAWTYKIDKFTIKELNQSERPFIWDTVMSLQPDFAVDKDGIILYNNSSYSPNQIANIGLAYLDSYQKTNNSEYLALAQKYADKLKEISVSKKGALYFPYNFNFAMHGKKDEVLMSPWYSGMAQGEALSFFVRLYEITRQKEYLDTADNIFKSFTIVGKNNSPWTVWSDQSNYYWVEEYPENEPDHTLNGFIYGLYGVYDYQQITKSDKAKIVFQSSLTTLKHYLPEFRQASGVSFYCLKHKVQNESYHRTHIEQLNMLYKMTGDEFFKTMADNFSTDFH